MNSLKIFYFLSKLYVNNFCVKINNKIIKILLRINFLNLL